MGLTTSRLSTPPQEDGSSSGESGSGSAHGNGNGADNPGTSGGTAGSSGVASTLFTWNFGGRSVFVTGSWDNWDKKTRMQYDSTTGTHTARLTHRLPEDGAALTYKFFVDGNWKCNRAQPTRTDERGNTNNYLTISTSEVSEEPEYHSRLPSLASDSSSAGSAADVPTLPRLLAPTNNLLRTHSIAPHIFVDRLFSASSSSSDPNTRELSMRFRYQAKVIETVFITPK